MLTIGIFSGRRQTNTGSRCTFSLGSNKPLKIISLAPLIPRAYDHISCMRLAFCSYMSSWGIELSNIEPIRSDVHLEYPRVEQR